MATRRESVQLSLVDAGFSTGMAKAAAATALLDKQLDRLDGTRVDFDRGIRDSNDNLTTFNRNAAMSSSTIDTFSGRMGLAVRAIGAFGPALAPIGAVAIPAVTGLASQLGFAAIAAGTAVAAFQGVGDTLTKVHEASLEPTVENLREAAEALERLSPAGRDLVAQMDSMRPILTDLRNTAQAGLFPGLIEGFQSLETLAPEVNRILATVSDTLGDLFADGANALAGPRFADFFAMIEREARPALEDMGHALGSVVHGLSEMWEAFSPLNRDFGGWLADTADSFDRWATGLSETEGFQNFIAYVRENGPLVADAVVAIADAVIQITQAAAPLGGPVLRAITAIADAFATIADSPLGTPIMAAVTAMSALSLASRAATASITATNAAMLRLGATSKATAGSTAAAATAASSGGAAGLPVLAGFLGVSNFIEETEALVQGRMDQMEYAWRRLIPAIGVIEDFGVKVPGFNDDVEGSGKAFGHLAEMSEVAMQNLGVLGASYEEVRSEGGKFTRDLRRQTREVARHERQIERTTARIDGMKQAIRDQGDAFRAAAEEFVNWDSGLSRGEFTVERYLDGLEKQTDAMRNFRLNAEKAVKAGVDPELVSHLRTMGREGALELRRLAGASEKHIGRANELWRDYVREGNLAESEVEQFRLKLISLGDTKAKPKVEVDNKQALTATDAAEQALANVADMHPNPKINVTSNASAAAAATAAALNQIADEQVFINVTRRQLGSLGQSNLEALGSSADGGTVPKTGLPYADRHPYLLADGEEVISNRFGQADRHRALLKAINANRLADGGTVRPLRGSSSQRLSINVTASELRGSISTPAGQLDLSAIIRAEAQDVYDQNRSFEQTQR